MPAPTRRCIVGPKPLLGVSVRYLDADILAALFRSIPGTNDGFSRTGGRSKWVGTVWEVELSGVTSAQVCQMRDAEVTGDLAQAFSTRREGAGRADGPFSVSRCATTSFRRCCQVTRGCRTARPRSRPFHRGTSGRIGTPMPLAAGFAGIVHPRNSVKKDSCQKIKRSFPKSPLDSPDAVVNPDIRANVPATLKRGLRHTACACCSGGARRSTPFETNPLLRNGAKAVLPGSESRGLIA
jgi:hypothetical protein